MIDNIRENLKYISKIDNIKHGKPHLGTFKYIDSDKDYNLSSINCDELNRAVATCICRIYDERINKKYKLCMHELINNLYVMNRRDFPFLIDDWNNFLKGVNKSISNIIVFQKPTEQHAPDIDDNNVHTDSLSNMTDEDTMVKQMYPKSYKLFY